MWCGGASDDLITKEREGYRIRELMIRKNEVEGEFLKKFPKLHSEEIKITRIKLLDLIPGRYLNGSNIIPTIDCQMFYIKKGNKIERNIFLELRTMSGAPEKDQFYFPQKTFEKHMELSGENYMVLVFVPGTRDYAFLTPHFIQSHWTIESKFKKGRHLFQIPKEHMVWKRLKRPLWS